MIHEQEKDAGTDHPTGLWSIGAGITLGWDSETGGLAYFDEDWGYQGYTVRQEFYGGAGDTYDESGMRVWRSVNGVRESVLPGVAVYREASAGAGYDLALLLNEGGFQAGEGGPEFFEVKDHQGNVRALVDGSGEVAQADGYHPYGAMVPLKVAAAAANAPWKWQGKEWDGDVGLFYFGARYWNVELALWLSPDPAGQFANPYTFGGDPVNFVDPDGRLAFLVPVVIGATVGAYVGASLQSKSWNPTKWDSDAWKGGIAGFCGRIRGCLCSSRIGCCWF